MSFDRDYDHHILAGDRESYDQNDGSALNLVSLMHEVSTPAAGPTPTPRDTAINADYIRDNFAGNRRTELLNLLRNNSVESITVGDLNNGSRPIRLRFSQDVSGGPLVVDRTVSGTLRRTNDGFAISNLRGVQITIGQGTVFETTANVTGLNYNGRILTVEHDASFVPNIPIPRGVGPADTADGINRALNAVLR
jgi:hypothetical protein